MPERPFKSLNRELLLEVKKRILDEPRLFLMEWWARWVSCGTACCIAGWTNQVLRERAGMPPFVAPPGSDGSNFAPDPVDPERYHDFENEAADALGIDRRAEDMWQLFIVSDWPDPFREEFEESEATGDHEAMAQVAAVYIDYLLGEETTPP